jgi:hypothetical protein
MYMHLLAAAAPVAAAAVPLEPVAQLLLAASLVLVEKEIIKVVLHQVAVVLLRQRILHQRQLHRQYQNLRLNQQVKFHSAIRTAARATPVITQRSVIITAMMDILVAFAQTRQDAADHTEEPKLS